MMPAIPGERAAYRRDGNRRCTPINADGTGEHPRPSALIGGFRPSLWSLQSKFDHFVNFVAT